MTELKPCTGPCGNSYPPTEDYFHRQGNGKGLRAECKACANGKRKAAKKRTPRPKQAPTHDGPRWVVAENADGERIALSYWQWDNPPPGFAIIGEGKHLLGIGERE